MVRVLLRNLDAEDLMGTLASSEMAKALRPHATPLLGADHLDSLIARMGSARFVLLGEASHGTHEFYALRDQISRRLIAEHGFSIVAVEADWPDARRVDRFVRGRGADRDAVSALRSFERFPTWMWRNRDVVSFVRWLEHWNRSHAGKAGFYGIDVYSLHSSVRAVLRFLESRDANAALEARTRYGCFDTFGDDLQRYGHATTSGWFDSCEGEVVAQLATLLSQRDRLIDGDEDAFFDAVHNARVVKNAERYYRAMFRGGIASWNLRDTHMADTVDALVERFDGNAKVIVWAHNSHLGDARATELGRLGELNLGQLLRERHPGQTFSLGFTTYDGTVTAASNWDESSERKDVRPALPGSYESLFHEVGVERFLLMLDRTEVRDLLNVQKLERAIGVIYRPDTERASHYFQARLADQFDAVIHVDRTTAVEPLAEGVHPSQEEPFETFPTGL